ncbi:MAG TPA: hypothetical protein VGQ78_05635 [Vicinamibacteria bacterium]|nr:hypothetical protein [Vicinamibacteria bacterium]
MGRPLAVWLLGLWLGVLAASWAAATVNFRTADRLAGAADRTAIAAAEERRAILRQMAAEINRWIFRWWPRTEVALGAALLLILRRTRGPAWLVAAAAVVALAQAAWLGPAITKLGRTLDLAPRPLPADIARRFGLLHGGYLLFDLLKAVSLVAAAAVCARAR